MYEPSSFRDKTTYIRWIQSLKEFFLRYAQDLHKVKHFALMIREGIDNISPFIRQATQSVCPRCKQVCCISKHGYYTYEDLIYLTALNIEPPQVIFGRNDTDPCQYLLERGCSMERWLRPSGCTWYFCESLLDYMETQPAYRDFDDSLQDIACLWIEMVEEFEKISAAKSPG